jgi:ADP-heptose:LPS heptosyltransferase
MDCVLLIGVGPSKDQAAENELLQGLPFLEIALVGQEDFDELVSVTFASDRFEAPKGMIEVIL